MCGVRKYIWWFALALMLSAAPASSSALVYTGANQYIIGKSLGHKSSDATEIYARLYNDPVRESVQRATEAMFRLKHSETV